MKNPAPLTRAGLEDMKRKARYKFAMADKAKKEGKPMEYKNLRIEAAKLMTDAVSYQKKWFK